MEWDTLLSPAATGATAALADVLPIAVPVLVAFAGLTIALRVFGKFGIKR